MSTPRRREKLWSLSRGRDDELDALKSANPQDQGEIKDPRDRLTAAPQRNLSPRPRSQNKRTRRRSRRGGLLVKSSRWRTIEHRFGSNECLLHEQSGHPIAGGPSRRASPRDSGGRERIFRPSAAQTPPQARPELVLQTGHTGPINAIALSAGGRFLVSGSDDNTIRLWDIATGNVLRTLVGHEKPVLAVAVSGDGRVIASGGDDSSVRVWDVTTGQLRVSRAQRAGKGWRSARIRGTCPRLACNLSCGMSPPGVRSRAPRSSRKRTEAPSRCPTRRSRP